MEMVTSRDVREIVSKLSSDKAKTREEGVKLLNTWLEGERSIGFCRFISENTAKLKPEEIPNSETWPFLVKLLMQCVSLEVSGSKRRTLKSTFSKTLRIVIQRAEDSKFPGVMPLLSVVKKLFSHTYDILNNYVSFQSEYGIILRHLLAVRGYQFHLRRRTYCSLVLLYMERVEGTVSEKKSCQYSQKEEAFRNILSLHSLLENPPCDFPDELRENLVKGFMRIFSFVSEESKSSRKLIECVNTFLVKDGPNLGSYGLELHEAVGKFVFGCWLTTHDRALKDGFICYAKLQLHLTRGSGEGTSIIEQVLDVVSKELDLGSSCSSVPWGDSTKDEKFGMLSSSQNGLVELAAHVFYKASVNSSRQSSIEKRARRQNAASCLMEALTEGKWLWNAAFSCLIRKYYTRISKDLLMDWFGAISSSFHSVLNDANRRRSFDALLWILRGLQELSSAFLLPDSQVEVSLQSSVYSSEFDRGWQLIWSSLVHGLAMFSSVTIVVDTTLKLLGSIILSDRINVGPVPQDVWDHQFFITMTSESVLYFIACYFSKMGSQGNLQDNLRLRKVLMRAILGGLSGKGTVSVNDRLVWLLPAAVFALCTGSATSIQLYKGCPVSTSSWDITEIGNNFVKMDKPDNEGSLELFECSVDVLTRMIPTSIKVMPAPPSTQPVRLPQQLKDPLLSEMNMCVLRDLKDMVHEKGQLSEVITISALLCYFIHGSSVTRSAEENDSFLFETSKYILDMLNNAVELVEKNLSDFQSAGVLGFGYDFNEKSSVVRAFRCFICSPVLAGGREKSALNASTYDTIILTLERLLKFFAELYVNYSEFERNIHSEIQPSKLSSPSSSDVGRIVDLELDVDAEAKDVDIIGSSRTPGPATPISTVNWKLGMISLISCFFSVLHIHTWDILFTLIEKECDPKVYERILYNLCQHPNMMSADKTSDLVNVMSSMIENQVKLKLDCFNIVVALHCLLDTLLIVKHTTTVCNGKADWPLKEGETDQWFAPLGDLANKISEFDLLNWFGRVKLINCICNFVLLNPQIGQTMIERLLLMLHDPDYRVRFVLAERIGVLFQTWDGHEVLFQDVCSNFGVVLVASSKENQVTARDVLALGPQSRTKMETVIITLMHLAFHSEKIELEAVFMMCTISATDPCQRELVAAALENLSRKLQYPSRFKYLEQLMGSTLFCWIKCGVSLAALLEISQLFIPDATPSSFIQSCSRWLLPALFLHQDIPNLTWAAKIAGQTLPVMVKAHFVPIFSVCMALHCSKRPESGKGATVLQNSILHLAEITESERDTMIQKNMVSIVGCIMSLASSAPEPAIPFFSKEAITCAVQTVVDGFVEVDECPTYAGVIDKINIFRPDRVFLFIVEMHYRIHAAGHHRHTCQHLASVDMLITILGHRAAVPSSFNYLFNLIGQYIGNPALQDHCCLMMSCLLDAFNNNPSNDIVNVLGEQLQYFVSKLVACCTPSEANSNNSSPKSSKVVSLLRRLIVESGHPLYDSIKELEPFPKIDLFKDISNFHSKLCKVYSPRDHLLKCAKRSSYLPPRLLSPSLQALHKKIIPSEASGEEENSETSEDTYWHSDKEVMDAVWTLVRMSASDEAISISPLVSDFVSRVGVGDPHCVVFHLPGEFNSINISKLVNHNDGSEFRFSAGHCLSDEILLALLKILKKYLMDDSVEVVDITSQTLRGILSTERGQRALLSFDSYERSLIEVHSKGINLELVENIMLDSQNRFKAEGISLEKPEVWSTDNKTFEGWICKLVYNLIGYCEDVVIRLCQDVAFLKAEVAELLFPSVIVSMAGRKDVNVDFQELISSQVKEHIFSETGQLIKSIQLMLNALNQLRTCYLLDRLSSSRQSKRDSSKNAKPSSYSSKSHSASSKTRDMTSVSTRNTVAGTTCYWDKVYWLSVDYLVVAKAAVVCGAYFTSSMYVEYWCEEHFNGLTLGNPDFSHRDTIPSHIEILVSAIKRINEPDSLYGVIHSNKLTSQLITFEHEGNWSKAFEYYDLQVRSETSFPSSQAASRMPLSVEQEGTAQRRPYKGVVRSLQQMGCMHVLDMYCQGLTSRKGQFQYDPEFIELQYEAAWRAGNWDFSLLYPQISCPLPDVKGNNFNENLHSCLRALREGDYYEFNGKLTQTKKELVRSVSCASEESTEFIYSTVVKLQILYHLGLAWDLRWIKSSSKKVDIYPEERVVYTDPAIPTMDQLSWLTTDWNSILERAQLHMNLLEPFIAFRHVLLQILGCKASTMQHLLQSASTLRKGSRFSQAAESLHEFNFLCEGGSREFRNESWHGRLEEAKLLRAQGQHEMAISLASYILQNYQLNDGSSNVHRLVGKWLAETRSSNSRTILEKYLKPAVMCSEDQSFSKTDKKSIERQSQSQFHLAHYADALFKSYEERLSSNEWQAALKLRKHKKMELEALIRRLKSSGKGEKTDYSLKIQELQKQLAMDKEEAEKLLDDRDNFLNLALEGYKRCLVIGDKYDVRVVFRLVSLWFSLSSRKNVIDNMLSTIDEVQSYKFVPLVYQIASRMGNSKDGLGSHSFQFCSVSLVKKMAIDHPYHTIFQLLALANGDRIKDKQRSRNSFVVDIDKKLAAERLLLELSKYHGPVIKQMKQMVEIYIKLAELETRREDTNKRIPLPRDIRSIRQLELVPVVTATFPVDRSCRYSIGAFPHFKGLTESVTVMNGINAPKVVECLGSDGHKYKQLAKSGNDDLRQDAVMEQFFGLVNTFLQNHRDTWKRRLGVRTYKVVPFTPSAGVLEWVDGTVPLGEYLIGSSRNGGAHARYGYGDWAYPKCREHMSNAKDKRKAFQDVCDHFRPVMHHFFLEKFLQPAYWFEKRLAYTRSVAASSMVGYIVGLGDRHAMNILIDQATAEVVHIDLGVAFEQGLMLKTPERVPFRLTRDIIDGMGVTGVEGVFRRSCEETLSVMRTNKEALLTIVEVFIHDPLYKWALSPLKALQRQKETDDEEDANLDGLQDEFEGNKDAARALMRVKQKLDGYEEGEMRSVHGQVQQLIQDAIDPDRICQMFPGWGAWM